MEESTTGLLNILNNTDIEELDDFIDEHGHSISIGEFFSDYLYSHNIKSSDIVKKCQGYISKSYIYDLLNGKKTNPSRDNVILLCLAADMVPLKYSVTEAFIQRTAVMPSLLFA